METKVMQVYYDSSAYPFKDQARETRYPVIGTSFTGASNTTRIRFYVNQFANIGTCTFVAITKLPSGKKLYEQLSKDTTSDTEPFVYLDISSAYTQEKGDIQIALNVYEGGVNISVDSDSGLYTISGSPIITATGNIKISVAYTPYMDTNYGSVPTISVQQALALVSSKLEEISGIVVIDSTSGISATTFTNGQMVYAKDTDIFYQVVSGEYVKQQLVDIAYEYAPSGSDVILTIKLSDGLGVYKTLTINLTTYLASLTYVNAHINNKNNPHEVTKAQVGLGNVVNTGDSNTPLQNGTTKFTTGGAYNLQVSLTNALNTAINTLNTNLKTYGKSLTIDETDFKLRLLDGNGNTLSTIDLPLEELIVDGEFDSETQTIILTLFNGNTIEIPVADLVAGLVSTDDLATALASYYTKTQVDSLLSAKANSSDVYTQAETNNLLSAKQDNLVSGTNIKTINNTSILGSGNYAFDSAFNELSTNALENQVVAKEFRETYYEIAMIREALFEVVLSEIDYSVDYAMTYVVPDTLSDTDGTHRVVYNETQLVSVSGNSVVNNQWVGDNKKDFTSSTTDTKANFQFNIQFYSYGTGYVSKLIQDITTTGFKSFIVSNTTSTTYTDMILKHNGSARDIMILDLVKQILPNHIYWVGFLAKGVDISVSGGLILNNISIIDLTKMFPNNTPTTTDDVRIQWLLSRGYITYNTGSLLSTSVSGLESKGANLCNKTQFSAYSYGDDYKKYNSNNAVQVKKGKYTLSANNSQTFNLYVQAFSIDNHTQLPASIIENINGLPSTIWDGYAKQTTFGGVTKMTINVLQDCILTFCGTNSVVLNPMFVIGETDLPYTPYVGTLSTILFTNTELKSAGSVHDYLEVVEGNVVEGEQRYNIVKHTLVGSVDLGTGNAFSIDSHNRVNIRFTSGTLPLPKSVASNVNANFLCSKYLVDTRDHVYSNTNNMRIAGGSSSDTQYSIYFYVYDNSLLTYTAEQLKEYLTGIYLQYELATTTTTTIATDLTFEQVSLIIQQGGTINTNYTNVPPNVTTTFVVKKAVGE